MSTDITGSCWSSRLYSDRESYLEPLNQLTSQSIMLYPLLQSPCHPHIFLNPISHIKPIPTTLPSSGRKATEKRRLQVCSSFSLESRIIVGFLFQIYSGTYIFQTPEIQELFYKCVFKFPISTAQEKLIQI